MNSETPAPSGVGLSSLSHRSLAVAAELPHTLPSEELVGEGHLFTLLPTPQSRWKSLVSGWSVQALSLVCFVAVCARFHENLLPVATYRVTNLVAYEPVALETHQPVVAATSVRPKPLETKRSLESKPALENKPPVVALVVTPQIKRVVERKSSEPEAVAPAPKLDNKMPVVPAAATAQIVAVGTFSHESPVMAPVAKLATTVQPGGFGDVSGNGAGHGPGVGATNPNVVMSSGFGNGAIDTVTGSHPKTAAHLASNGANAPVEITFKPKPDYTDEGRKQKINGEVRLEVLFKSDGRVHVTRVVQGLGFGLDEQAVKAAEQIKFKPALHEGQPVDSMALVHIIFELIS
jgi:TonB family protein